MLHILYMRHVSCLKHVDLCVGLAFCTKGDKMNGQLFYRAPRVESIAVVETQRGVSRRTLGASGMAVCRPLH